MYEIAYHKENLSQYSFLVTGGAGFIGSNLVEYLLKYNAKKVRVLDNFSTGLQENIDEFKSNPSFELLVGDIRDLDTCKKAVKDMDYVSHQAALGSVPRSINDPITSNEVNVGGFLNMLVAVRDEASVRRMIYAASSSTYGDSPELPKVEGREGKPLSPYAVTKLVNELYADVFSRVYGLHTIGMRYFNIFGPKQNPNGQYAAVIPLFMQSAIEKKAPIINGDGETSRDFTFIENAIQANISGMLHSKELAKHEAVNIAAGERTTLKQLWQFISEELEVHIDPLHKAERPGDVKHSLADIKKAKNIFFYSPEFSVREGLRRTIKWYSRLFEQQGQK